jgi:hypothetical protein
MRALVLASFTALGAALAACSATTNVGFGGNSTGAGGAGTGSSSSDINLGGGIVGTGGSTTGNDCSAASQLVYVLSTDDGIYSFDPPSKQFNLVAQLNCDTTGQLTPNSMAIDRNAVAWINYVAPDDSSGVVYRFDLTTKKCEKAPAVTLDYGWTRLGMGFSTDAAGSTNETLFVAGTADQLTGVGPGLGKLNMANHQVVPIGDFASPLSGQSAELTGTGDGRLFGFFTSSPVEVAQIAKTASGGVVAITKEKKVTSTPPLAWAFSFWGGSFYLYMSDGTSNSTVTKFDPSANTLNPSYATAPFIIVGAGVSTCAPLTPPS